MVCSCFALGVLFFSRNLDLYKKSPVILCFVSFSEQYRNQKLINYFLPGYRLS